MPSSSGITVVVRSSTAGMSEASIVSPSPTPTISGDETFTPINASGSLQRADDERVGALELRDRVAARRR